jgi:hypothetical protein
MPETTYAGEALAAPLRRHLLQHFPADRAYPRAALRAEGMPPLIAAFLDRMLDRWVEIERGRFREDWLDSGWLDADDTDVQRTEHALFEALRRSARVPADAWEDTLGGAVDLVARFLTVPARALTDAIFEGAPDPLPAATIRARLALFDAYPYLADIASAYLDRKQPDTLDPSELFALLDRIDRRFVSGFGREDWLALLTPLFALTRHAPTLDGVPASLLEQFFEAKGRDDLATLVAEQDAEVLDEAALRNVLAPAFPDAPPEVPDTESIEADEDEPAEVEAAPEPVAETPVLKEEPDDEWDQTEPMPPKPIAVDEAPDGADPSDDTDTARPLWERFAERTSDGDNVNARFGPPDPDSSHNEAPADIADAAPLWKRFFARPEAAHNVEPSAANTPAAATVTETSETPETPAEPADSLDALEQRILGPMPPAQRKRFIKHLFRGDAGKYVTVLHTLDAADSWTDASRIIARDVFRPARVNIYGEHAVAFTDAVEARFRK